jgi:hypothetical protein
MNLFISVITSALAFANGASEIELPSAQVKLMWFSPILVQPIPEEMSFSSSLASIALEAYDAFVANATNDVSSSAYATLHQHVCAHNDCDRQLPVWMDMEPHHLNDAFYEWQKSHPVWSATSLSPHTSLSSNDVAAARWAVRKLRQYVILATSKLRESTGAVTPTGATSDNLYCWSSIHPAGQHSLHLPHTHASSGLSAAFYAQLPPSPGKLWFHDPRGPRPPFDHT